MLHPHRTRCRIFICPGRMRVRWPPGRSLFGRSVTALVAFTLAFQVLAYTVSGALVVWPLLKAAADDLARTIVLTSNTISKLPPAEQAKAMAELGERNQLQISLASGPLPGERSWVPFIEHLEQSLSAQLGKVIEVRSKNNAYYIDVEVPGLSLRYAFPHSRVGTQPLLAAVILFFGTLALSYTAAIIVAKRLARPLNILGEAAAEVGRGGTPQLTPQHVSELDSLVESFNTMARKVQALLNNRTTVLAGISHDLRSPIARARVALELAKETPDMSLLNDIDRHLSQMEKLLNQFFEFARGVEYSQIEQTPLDQILPVLSEQLSTGHSAIVLNCEPNLINVNRIALERVFTNLVENAQRYGGDQNVEVICTRDRGGAVVEVMDRGPGIPHAERERVFEPFVRLENSRNPATGGSGLGLSIVREICLAQNWRIELLDREGGGLRAVLTLKAS